MARAAQKPSAIKDRALDAVESIVRESGIAGLTLNAVADAIGASKGGLLHHYTSKDALVDAFLNRTANFWRESVQNALANVHQGSGRIARVLIETFMIDPNDWEPRCKRSSAAMMILLIQNPKLSNPLQSIYRELIEMLTADGLPKGMGDCILATIDGVWLQAVTELAKVDAKRIESMRARLLEWIAPYEESVNSPRKDSGHKLPSKKLRSGRTSIELKTSSVSTSSVNVGAVRSTRKKTTKTRKSS